MTYTSYAAIPRIFVSFVWIYGVNYDKFINRQDYQLRNEKLSKAIQVEQPKASSPDNR